MFPDFVSWPTSTWRKLQFTFVMVPQLHSILTWKSWFGWSPIYGSLLASYLAPSHNYGVGSSTTLPWVVCHFLFRGPVRKSMYSPSAVSQTHTPMNIKALLSPQDITPSLHVLRGSQVTKQTVSNDCHISSARTKVVAVAWLTSYIRRIRLIWRGRCVCIFAHFWTTGLQ